MDAAKDTAIACTVSDTVIVAKDATTAVIVDNVCVGAQTIGAVAKDAETFTATCPRASESTPRSSLSLKYDKEDGGGTFGTDAGGRK